MDFSQLLLTNTVVMLLYMTVWFGIAYKRQRLDTVDTAWGLGFVVVAWLTYIMSPNVVGALVVVLITLWGSRLAGHIWERSSRHDQDDRRYREISSNWQGNVWRKAYTSIFLLQGLLVLIISAPVLLLSRQSGPELQWLIALGTVLWLVGFSCEVIADRQLKQYLSQDKRPQVLETGLWKYSRHPNYFGEITMWWAIGVIALQVSYGWVGLIGPALLSFLIVKVSGIPPIERRRAKNPAYQAYIRRTSPLIPLPRRSTP